MRLLSWNVNGLRACTRKGFADWLSSCDADIIGLQEVRARPEQLDPAVREPEGWTTHFVAAKRPGYSGVGLYSRTPPDSVETSLGLDEFDDEGRLQIARFGDLVIANCYFPNGSGKNRDNSRVPFKLRYYQTLFKRLEAYKEDTDKLIVLGDFNTAHQAIDLARPKQNQGTSGFLPEEREELQRWLDHGWIDSFRLFHPDEPDHYSWWSQRSGARARNVGWRIDYILISAALEAHTTDAFILPDVMGSDHCPIGIELV